MNCRLKRWVARVWIGISILYGIGVCVYVALSEGGNWQAGLILGVSLGVFGIVLGVIMIDIEFEGA